MRTHVLYFLALLFVALAFVPAGAHAAELMAKMRLDEAEYRTVQQIYRGWALFGTVIFASIVVTLLLAIDVRRTPAFASALVAVLCLVATQVIFWTWTFPVNQTTDNWTVMPANWLSLRAQWEYSHAAAAALSLAALIALIVSVLRHAASPRTRHA
jgi:hypothetical protein